MSEALWEQESRRERADRDLAAIQEKADRLYDSISAVQKGASDGR